MLPVLAQPQPDYSGFFSNIEVFLNHVGAFLEQALNWAGANLIWVILFFVFGGGALLAAPFKWAYNRLPHRRRIVAQRAEARRLARAREEDLDAQHAENCPCGNECEGRRACTKHHPECNCDHVSHCVCLNEKDCTCECRCDCKECYGYKPVGPLVRRPEASPLLAAGTPPPVTPQPAAQPKTSATPASAQPQPLSWTKARKDFLRLSEEYAAYECDPSELVRLPALADVTFGPTATFIEAFYQANQRVSTTKPADPEAAARFVEAAAAARTAWTAAVEAAERVMATRLESDEQALLRQVKRSLRLAENAETPQERAQALGTAGKLMRDLALRTEESGRWRLPKAARLELETWPKPELGTATTAVQDQRSE